MTQSQISPIRRVLYICSTRKWGIKIIEEVLIFKKEERKSEFALWITIDVQKSTKSIKTIKLESSIKYTAL